MLLYASRKGGFYGNSMTKKDTQLVGVGRDKKFTGAAVNPRLARASTIVFDTVQDMHQATKDRHAGAEYYGRRGTSTTFAFTEAMCELENAAGCYVYSCGAAAIAGSLLSFLSAGDHLLMLDSVYEPTREFCDHVLKRMGVEISYYDPLIGAGIAELVKENTKIIYLESPGSLTMEVQDLPAIVAVAQQKDIVTMIDNTFCTPVNFKPLDFGIDVSIHSATKYISGHSDIMLGVASANERYWPRLRKSSFLMGYSASVDDVYTAMRGLRTLSVRLKQHEQSAMQVAKWLQEQSLVDRVLHPNFESCPGHEFYRRDVSGGNGLFSIVLKHSNDAALTALLDGMQHFAMGFSWGGYESLILAASDFSERRTATKWTAKGSLIRLHIGLEDPEDLIADLAQGLKRFSDVAKV